MTEIDVSATTEKDEDDIVIDTLVAEFTERRSREAEKDAVRTREYDEEDYVFCLIATGFNRLSIPNQRKLGLYIFKAIEWNEENPELWEHFRHEREPVKDFADTWIDQYAAQCLKEQPLNKLSPLAK